MAGLSWTLGVNWGGGARGLETRDWGKYTEFANYPGAVVC